MYLENEFVETSSNVICLSLDGLKAQMRVTDS